MTLCAPHTHIDSLAERGVRSDNAFTVTAICSPSRASFYTGLYPHHLHNRYGDPAYAAIQQDLMARMERHMAALGDAQLGWFRRMGPVY